MFSGVLPANRKLAQGPHGAVFLTLIRAFDTGCVLDITAILAQPATRQERRKLFGEIFAHHLGPSGELPAGLLRFAVEYPDGRQATTLADPVMEEPRPPVLRAYGGLGHDRGSEWLDFSEPLWLWTLPPAQTFQLAVEWPIAGIPETRVSIDGAAIVEAARQSRPFG